MARLSMMTRRTLLASTILTVASQTLAVPAMAASGASYRDARAPIADRVRDLLGRMTLEEKAAQVRCLWFNKGAILDSAGDFSSDKASKAIADGIGQVAAPNDTLGTPRLKTELFRSTAEGVAFANTIQRFLVEKTRLGIPALFHAEAAHGFKAVGATVFPSPIGLGSSWDRDLVEQVFTVTGHEARAGGANVVLAPVVDLLREPRWGRSEESFGEDPYLVGQMGVAAVRGLQGRTRPLASDRVFATLKHFIHGAPQGGLNTAPADMSERTLREDYLVPFAEIIRTADPAVIMPSYNEIEGVPSHANYELLTRTGRERLGFKGAYFSDYLAVSNLVAVQHVAATQEDAAVLALKAGVDAELPDGECYSHLPALVRSGRVPQALLDAAVARILAMKFEAGLFEAPYFDPRRVASEINTAANIGLARTAAQKSLILLKNDGVLPLDPHARTKLAVIGPNAAKAMSGGYSGVNEKSVGVLAGLQAAGASVSIEHAEGVRLTERDPGTGPSGYELLMGPALKPVPAADNAARIAEAVALAGRSDVVLMVLGDDVVTTHETIIPIRPGDRSSLTLFGDQDKLVEAVLATGKPVVALLLNARPLAVNRLAERTNALLEGWYMGQEGGAAFADVLFGKVSPGGKLTVSVPRSAGALPVFYNRHPSALTNNYIEADGKPLYPFGHGLSYTSFDISAPRLSKAQIRASETVGVEVDVVNTGHRSGDEVVQLYIRDDVSSAPRPVLELKGFERVTLKPGERRTVRFDLAPDALAFWDIDMKWSVEPGTFTVSAGASSAALKAATLTVV